MGCRSVSSLRVSAVNFLLPPYSAPQRRQSTQRKPSQENKKRGISSTEIQSNNASIFHYWIISLFNKSVASCFFGKVFRKAKRHIRHIRISLFPFCALCAFCGFPFGCGFAALSLLWLSPPRWSSGTARRERPPLVSVRAARGARQVASLRCECHNLAP